MFTDSFDPDHEPIKYKDYQDSHDEDSDMVPSHTSLHPTQVLDSND